MPKLSISEAAYILGVSTDTLRRWEKEGKITSERTEGGHRRYDLTNILKDRENSGSTILYARQIKRILSFNKTVLLPAVELMDSTIPKDGEYEEVNRILKRYVGQEKTDILLQDSVTWWDQFNAITAAANQVNSDKKRQELQIKGGAILDRFLVHS